MDNLQEIRQKLEEQTRRYEDIFKNEFVLTILKSCERAREDLRQINGELAKLNFAAKYQFDVHYVKDGSEYAKVIEYARYLDEREQLGGSADGQMTFEMLTSVSDEEGEQLEAEMKQIINRIIEKNSEETIARFADYRNYMNYEILISNRSWTGQIVPPDRVQFRRGGADSVSSDPVVGPFADLQPASQFHAPGFYRRTLCQDGSRQCEADAEIHAGAETPGDFLLAG